MNWLTARPLEVIPTDNVPLLAPDAWVAAMRERLADGAHPVALFKDYGRNRVLAVFGEQSTNRLILTSTRFPVDAATYPSLTAEHPCMNLFECELYEQSGITPSGHPWLRPVHTMDAWRKEGAPYSFYRVEGDEIHEVAVGPVHAGVIEPGHFRFQCHGEQILHLEIQLGFQFRGVETMIPGHTPAQQLILVESIAGDSVIAHATAFCSAMEALTRVSPSLREQAVRGIAAELERIAMHLATLGGIAIDIGFSLPSAALGNLRTAVINLSADICGSRFGRGWIEPGGVGFDITPEAAEKGRQVIHGLLEKFTDIEVLLFNAASALARMEETGVVTLEWAGKSGLVGLAARASGVSRDVRSDYPYGVYRFSPIPTLTLDSGDVYARAKLRAVELRHSANFVLEQLDQLAGAKPKPKSQEPARDSLVVSLVEGHRGEVAHVILTDATGRLSQIKIKDPSFHNWHGLSLAVRENGISDFPLCNKSFDLSYAGHDL